MLVGRPEGKRTIRIPRSIRKNIKMDLTEIDWRLWTGSIWLRIHFNGWLL
jgi:hypothetical protein